MYPHFPAREVALKEMCYMQLFLNNPSKAGKERALMRIGLSFVFQSDFGNAFMYKHSMNAPDEMKELHKQFYHYIKGYHSTYSF